MSLRCLQVERDARVMTAMRARFWAAARPRLPGREGGRQLQGMVQGLKAARPFVCLDRMSFSVTVKGLRAEDDFFADPSPPHVRYHLRHLCCKSACECERRRSLGAAVAVQQPPEGGRGRGPMQLASEWSLPAKINSCSSSCCSARVVGILTWTAPVYEKERVVGTVVLEYCSRVLLGGATVTCCPSCV